MASHKADGAARLEVPLPLRRSTLQTLPSRSTGRSSPQAKAAHSPRETARAAREETKREVREAQEARSKELKDPREVRPEDVARSERPAHAQASASAAPEMTPAPIIAPMEPSAPVGAASLLAQAQEDPTLRAVVLPQTAHVRCEVDGAGELALHLRVRDGVADVRLDGQAAQLLNRVSDLEAALASEGLRLGSFDLPQDQQRRHEQANPADDDVPFRPRPNPNRAPEAAAVSSAGRLHVKA